MPGAWAKFRPTLPQPDFVSLLGAPCEDDWGYRPIHVRCGKAHRLSIVMFTDWDAVVGPYPQSFLPVPLAHARVDYGGTMDLYVDGPYLWLKIVLPPYTARLVVADRRSLTDDNRAFLNDALGLRAGESIHDDETLRAAFVRQDRRLWRGISGR